MHTIRLIRLDHEQEVHGTYTGEAPLLVYIQRLSIAYSWLLKYLQGLTGTK